MKLVARKKSARQSLFIIELNMGNNDNNNRNK
jgi:hypothetical protein